MFSFLAPVNELSAADVRRGMRFVVIQGCVWQFLGVLVFGLYLTALVLELHGSYFTLGLISGLGSLAAAMQIPGAILADRIQRRKAAGFTLIVLNRILVFCIPLTVLLLAGRDGAEPWIVAAIVTLVTLFNVCANLNGPFWGSWIRDLVPDQERARFHARQQAATTVAGALLSVGAAFWADHLRRSGVDLTRGYAWMLMAGALAGCVTIFTVHLIPEPRMESRPASDWRRLLLEPLRDANFRRWSVFNLVFSFGANLVGPLVGAHLMKRLGLGMVPIMALALVSQLIVVGTSPFAAALVNRFNAKSALIVAVRFLVFTQVMWAFTMTARPNTIVCGTLLVALYVLGGAAGSLQGVASGTLSMQLVPKGRASAYMAVGAILAGLAGFLGSLTGGHLADLLDAVELSVPINLVVGERQIFSIPAMRFRGLDFLFVLAALVSLGSLAWLKRVQESKEYDPDLVMGRIVDELQRGVRQVTHIFGSTFGPAESGTMAVPSKPEPGRAPDPAAKEPGRP